jgi:hypothetical protein
LPLVILFLAVLLLETRVSCLVYSSASFYSLAVLLFGKKQEAHHHVRNGSLSLSLSLCALHFMAKFKLQTRNSSNNNLATCSMKFPKNGTYSQKAILKIKTAKIKCFV